MQVARGLFLAVGSLILTGSLRVAGALPEEPCKGGRAPFEMQKAVPEAPVRWKVAVPCGASDEMTQIVRLGAGRLLVVYAEGPPQLIDTRRGALLWTQEAILDKSPTGQPGADAISYLTSFQDLLLLRGDRPRRSRLHAIGLDGKPRWTLSWEAMTPPMLIPLVDAGLLVAVSRSSSSGSVACYELKGGTKLWERSGSTPFQAIADLPSLSEARRLYLFGERLEALDPSTGKVLWQRADLSIGPDAPYPKVDVAKLHVIDRKGCLQVLAIQSGKSITSIPLPNSASYSNIVPTQDRTYIRGLTQVKNAAPRYVVMAVDHAKGTVLWEYWSDEPSISNIIEKNELLFFGTPSTFVALDRNLGQVKVRSKASDVGHAFPVRLIEYPEKFVFVGELVVVGFDPGSGREVFREGFDPISQTEHLDGVEAYLAKLWEDLRHYGSIGKSAFKDEEPNAISSLWKYSLGSAAFEASRSSQESADHFRKSARDSWSKYQASRSSDPKHLGDGSLARQSAMASYAADTNAAVSRAFDSVGYMATTVGNVQRAIAEFTQKDRDRVRLLLKTKRFLHSLYSLDQDEDYVWRPRRNPDGTHGLQVVDLRTGKMLETVLTPSFTTHSYLGFECFFDGQDGVIYAQAMRIAAGDEQEAVTKAVAKALGKEVYGRYVVAIPASWK